MGNLFQWAYVGGIIICAIFAGRNSEQPYHVPMCLVASGPNGEDMDINVWSDYITRYKERHPGSYCGKCGAERQCPTDEKKKVTP